MRFQSETTKINNKSRTLPYIFTKQSVAMLDTVLRTNAVEEMSIKIMDAFVTIRKFISINFMIDTLY